MAPHEMTFCLAPLLFAGTLLPVPAWQRFLRARLFAPAESVVLRLSRLPPPTLYVLLFAWGFGIAAALWLFIRQPEAHIHDEASYLLAADTFARGRVTNPAFPETIRAHFEALHIIVAPSYMSKYPPGQGLLLALGILLGGNPAAGLWINAGLVCAGALYALLPLVRRRVAILAALLAVLHPAVLKWTQSFWGGNLSLFAGLLLVGGAIRLFSSASVRPSPLSLGRERGESVTQAVTLAGERPSPPRPPLPRKGEGGGGVRSSVGVAVGTALALLANSRPFEGLVAASLTLLPVLPVLWRGLRTAPGKWISRLLLPAGAVLAVTAVLMLAYNVRVTGKPLRMPYAVHEDTYGVVPLFLFQDVKEVPETLRHDTMRFINAYTSVYGYWGERDAARNIWRGIGDKADTLARSAFQCFDPTVYWLDTPPRAHPLTDFLKFVPAFLLVPGLIVAVRKSGVARYAVFALAAFVGVICLGTFINPHYGAPVGGFALIVWVMAWRYTHVLRSRSGRNRRIGRAVSRAFLLLYLLSAASCVAFFAGDEWRWMIQDRRPIGAILTRVPGKHLVLVYYGATNVKSSAEWVYNGADIAGQKVVWARYLSPGENTNLQRHFADRQVWLLDATVPIRPHLYRYDPARMRDLPFPPPRTIDPGVVAKLRAGLPTKPKDKSGVDALPATEQAMYHTQVRERSRVRRLLAAVPEVK
ncbi:MAG: hypothetical protein H7145_15800 [Akkermansiaceae bacterium]|nr:hypothetical protein [Armatimonadota bacterium]